MTKELMMWVFVIVFLMIGFTLGTVWYTNNVVSNLKTINDALNVRRVPTMNCVIEDGHYTCYKIHSN